MKKTIAICCSASFFRQAVTVGKALKKMGFKVLLPKTAKTMQREGSFRVRDYKTWFKDRKDYKKKTALIKAHFKEISKADAILVLNFRKNHLDGYIGGNTLMEMAIALYLNKKIYILNEIDDKLPNKEEVWGCLPVMLDGRLEKL
jgi:nucleoside 2-deoxyribosyltransferase